MILTNLFKRFCTELIIGLMKDLIGFLKQSSLNTQTFQLIDHYQEVIPWNYLWIKKSRKRTNTKNNNQKCFFWYHIRHTNSVKIHPGIITQKDKELANDLNYDRIKFSIDKKGFSKIEKKSNICINVFFMKIMYPFQSTFHIKSLKIQWICWLYLMKTSHNVCI